MINEAILNYLILFILLELYEISWQKAQTLMGMLSKMYSHYKKSMLIFLLMHPTFYFSIGFAIITNYNPLALLLVFIKTLDMVTKILLIQQIFIKKELSQEMSLMLLAPLNNFLPYLGIIVYPPLIYLAI